MEDYLVEGAGEADADQEAGLERAESPGALRFTRPGSEIAIGTRRS